MPTVFLNRSSMAEILPANIHLLDDLLNRRIREAQTDQEAYGAWAQKVAIKCRLEPLQGVALERAIARALEALVASERDA
jgi:hypothetical protein